MRPSLFAPRAEVCEIGAIISEYRNEVKQKILKNRNGPAPGEFGPESARITGAGAPGAGSFFRAAAAMGLGRLAGPGRPLGPHAFDLAPRQGDIDFPDPVQLYPVDRLG